MTLNNKKMIIISSILGVTVILIVLLMLLGANLIIVKIPSISSLLGEYGLVKKSEKDLSTAQGTYYTTVSNLEKAENDYSKQKNKYNSISDETINVIKEATTEESYNLEYMWIKLGNYAKKNNLEIVMVEPGGKQSTNTNNNSSSGSSTNNTNSNSTTTTTTTTTTSSSTTNNSTDPSTNNSSDASASTSSSSALKIEVKGSYMNISDFIFEVENDTSLRFKLDNISMDYVEGTTVKASFDVKNIVINK
jgi:hypothetical protein